jgi:hypothetical protein
MKGDEITTHGYGVLAFAKCITIMIAEFAVRDPLSIRWVLDEIGFGESMRLCVNLYLLLDNNLYLLLDNKFCLLSDNKFCLLLDNTLIIFGGAMSHVR